ncbi:lipase 1-like [Sitodiplosis mosellana]|uniref:lipase 1-like n=1 Tax=Sitodiplosis mosellana TaxID=263140 RepID=UPI002444D9AD|nr:lipase 1-like [Sitodiplosis mosellana]XP_055300715.1 lipase 1-like [Sitodiplosis mosellana]
MWLKLCLMLVFFAIPLCHSDSVMNMIQAERYPAEKHTLFTKDGYILTVYRIPNMSASKYNRKVVLFMHGMTSSCPAFLTFGRHTSAAYKMSDAGYDVWLLCARGTTYSRRHIRMDPKDPKFWDFSWHEIGVYDIPAAIDYVLDHTNQTKLTYIGHSQGVTAFYVTLSELPEYNDKITIAHLMTPPVILKHNHPMVPRSMDGVHAVAAWFRNNGIYEVLSHSGATMDIITAVSQFCMRPTGRDVCRSFVYILFGPSNLYFDELLATILNHIPGGASYKQFIHYAQIAAAQRFQRYHHGIEKNMQIYGTPEPPEYDLSKVRANIHIMHGTNDWLTPSDNVPILANAMGRYPVAISKFPGYNHIDFAYGSNLDMVHRKIFKVQKLFY